MPESLVVTGCQKSKGGRFDVRFEYVFEVSAGLYYIFCESSAVLWHKFVFLHCAANLNSRAESFARLQCLSEWEFHQDQEESEIWAE